MKFESFCQARIERIETFLAALLPEDSSPLFAAMRYAVLNGGKRLRPLLVYATGEALGSTPNLLDAPAAAVELIHCYSLIHDDLPAMDNDDLRRGKPTCHKVFGDAMAILAGDALQTLAFEILTDSKMIKFLAEKSGKNGMVGGQALDLASEGKQHEISLKDLTEIHSKKTGALIEASVTLGALSADADPKSITQLQEYARCVGLSFQIQDDILDIESNSETLGKSIGKDQQQNKATFPSTLGMQKAKEYAHRLHQQALEALGFLNKNDHYLANFSALFINRCY